MKQNNIRIKRHFSIVGHSLDQVELRFGVWNPISFFLDDTDKKGKLFSIVKDLNGEHSIADIAKRNNVKRSEVESLVDHIKQFGAIETNASNALDFYIDNIAYSLKGYQESAKVNKKIIILGDSILTNTVYESLSRLIDTQSIMMIDERDPLYLELAHQDNKFLNDGFLLQEQLLKFEHWQDHFIVSIHSTPNLIINSKINRIAHDLNISWMQACMDGPFILIGPTIIGNNGACYDCFETRIGMNLREYSSYQKYKNAILEGNVYQPTQSYLTPILSNILVSHLVSEIMNYYLTESNFTNRKVFSIYMPTMEISFSDILRVPNCQTCGSVAARDEQQLYFDMQAVLENAA